MTTTHLRTQDNSATRSWLAAAAHVAVALPLLLACATPAAAAQAPGEGGQRAAGTSD